MYHVQYSSDQASSTEVHNAATTRDVVKLFTYVYEQWPLQNMGIGNVSVIGYLIMYTQGIHWVVSSSTHLEAKYMHFLGRGLS